jgi:hypothetical protein
MWNALNVLRLAVQVYEERNVTARPHNSFEDQQMCDLLLQILDIKISFQIISSKPPDSEEDVPVSRPSSGQSSHSSYHPSPKKRSNENVKMEDREQAVQFWPNEDGKKRYGLATLRKLFRFVRMSTVSPETSNRTARSPNPTDQENGIRPTVRRIH